MRPDWTLFRGGNVYQRAALVRSLSADGRGTQIPCLAVGCLSDPGDRAIGRRTQGSVTSIL